MARQESSSIQQLGRRDSGKARLELVVLAGLVTTLICGCARQSTSFDSNAPGFFSGVLHGVLLPFSFIASLFSEYRIYAFPNTGVWYDFGFILGLPFSFGWFIVLFSPGLRALSLYGFLLTLGLVFNPFTLIVAICLWEYFHRRQ